MKKLYYLFLVGTMATYGQTQVGADIDGEAANDQSGTSVSISADGSIVAIGAPNNAGTGPNSGQVRVYKNVSGVWTQIGADINGEAANDHSGCSVSLSADGSIVAIGATNNDGNGSDSGHVRVYKNVSGVWTKIGADIDGEAANDLSGYSVSLSADGSTVAIGAINNSGNGNFSGHVRIYKNISGVWTQIGTDINGAAAYDQCGRSVSLSANGSIVAIGTPLNSASGNDTGRVRVYKDISGVWTQIGADIVGEGMVNWSGWSVSLSADGSIIAIGANANSDNGAGSGQVRVYKNTSSVWTQVGADINGEAFEDNSGYSVSLSADGSIVAIGAPYNKGNSAYSIGHVRVYKNISGVWTQIGIDIDGEGLTNNDNSGYSVSLAGNGNFVAIGAPYNSGNGISSGHVRIYDLSAALSSNTFVLNNFSIYPNPSHDVLNISLKENLVVNKVTIYNTIGQVVKSVTTPVISIADIAKGNYFVEVVTNNGKATKKLVIE